SGSKQPQSTRPHAKELPRRAPRAQRFQNCYGERIEAAAKYPAPCEGTPHVALRNISTISHERRYPSRRKASPGRKGIPQIESELYVRLEESSAVGRMGPEGRHRYLR